MRCGGLFRSFLAGDGAGAAFEFEVGEHGATALRSAAIAVAGIGEVGVVEIVLVEKLFAGGDVAASNDEDAAVDVFGLAVGRAGVVEEHAGAEAVDDLVAVADAEEVGDDALGVADVGEPFGEVGAVVFEDALAFADGVERDAAGGVDGRRLDEQARGRAAFGSLFGARWHGVEYSKGSGCGKGLYREGGFGV